MPDKNKIIARLPLQLADNKLPGTVLKEVKNIFLYSYSVREFNLVKTAFKTFLDLFNGRFPGYRSCNTPYHDITHSLDTLLVFSCIVDGYNIEKETLPVNKVRIGIISILFHDSGYIQKKDDTTGTGAKHARIHEKRSIDFIKVYFNQIGLSKLDFLMAKNLIQCTDLRSIIADIKFKSKEEEILGFMVGTSDLIGQMAERKYLEKLPFLYQEFKEGKIPGYDSEEELLRNTVKFYKDNVKNRLEKDFKNVYKFLRAYFKEREHIDSNLYIDAIERQLNYLKEILNSSPESYKKKLRRD